VDHEQSPGRRRAALFGGLAAAALVGLGGHLAGLAPAAEWTAAITALCAAWWVTEPIAIPATSIIPFPAFPLTGVLDAKSVATAYGHDLIPLLLGGFVLSTAIDPERLMIPASLPASCAFLLPVATAPNAIVFGSGRISIAEMAKVGLAINLIGVVVITIMFLTVGAAVFGIDPGAIPVWATAGAAG